MNIYLNIDGVLLNNKGELADFAEVFLQALITRWPDSTYWLSNYCWKGKNQTLDIIFPKLKKKRTMELIEFIKPTDWDELKTDAIDFTKPFLWFENEIFSDEMEILNHYHATKCFRKIDLVKDPTQLLNEVVFLKSLA